MALIHVERAADGAADGLLVLHRGSLASRTTAERIRTGLPVVAPAAR